MSKKVLNIAEHKQEEWWCKYGKRTSAIITEKRSVVRTTLKNNFMSKLKFFIFIYLYNNIRENKFPSYAYRHVQ